MKYLLAVIVTLIFGMQPLPAQEIERIGIPGLEKILASPDDQLHVVNFWATWCPPCVRELPAFDRFASAQRGRVQVVGLAIDREQPVRDFLARQPVSFPIGLAGSEGAELSRRLGNTGGGLPFTVLLDSDGIVQQTKMGETHLADLEAWTRKL